MCVKHKCARKIPEHMLLPEEEGWANTRVPGVAKLLIRGLAVLGTGGMTL